ncbi:MAG: DinB family protein [Spirochaetes bacterium]|nr:DinB family protein [Spirochaetota bacterium]
MTEITTAELEALRGIPGIIGRYAAAIPEGDLDVRRSDDAWTVREHLYHIADVQEMLLGRMRTIIEQDEPVIEPFFPQGDPGIAAKYGSVREAMEAYRDCRERQLRLLESAPPEAMRREAAHRAYRHYSLPVLVTHMLFHEYWHMYRIEELWLTRDEYFS